MSNQQDDTNLFFSNFFGEYVQVISAIGNEPIEVNGFLLHKDEEYLYMGSSLDRIDAVVRCDSVVIIQVNEEGMIHPALEELGDPESDADIN